MEILSVAKWTAVAAPAITVRQSRYPYGPVAHVQLRCRHLVRAVRLATFANLVGGSIGSVLNVRVARYSHIDHLENICAKRGSYR